MKQIISKQNIPLVFLIIISLSSTFYYKSNSWINGFGTEKYEWALLLDVFITIPLICFFCLRKNLKQALIKSIVYMGLLILLGSFIIPEEHKYFMLHLEKIRYVVLIVVAIFELLIITSVVVAIRAALRNDKDPDRAIGDPINKYLGQTFISAIMQFDIRMWTYALFPKKVRSENFVGDKHFYSHLKDGVQSFLQGFVFLIIFEIPLVHLLLHFIWSPMAANIITALTLFSLVYFIAEYRAIEKRPVSVTHNSLIVRYGLSNPLIINLSEISSVSLNHTPVLLGKKNKSYNLFGNPNIVIKLKDTDSSNYSQIYLGLNNPIQFVEYCNNAFLKLKHHI